VPVSVAHSKLMYDALKGCNVRLISALPETWLAHLIRLAEEDPQMTSSRRPARWSSPRRSRSSMAPAAPCV
jgi:sulfopyruvate decarboxylase TPP-binding subunit